MRIVGVLRLPAVNLAALLVALVALVGPSVVVTILRHSAVRSLRVYTRVPYKTRILRIQEPSRIITLVHRHPRTGAPPTRGATMQIRM